MKRDALGGALLALWRRLPVAVRAIVAGVAVAAAGTLPWILFGLANQVILPVVPWAILPATFYLWLFWRYLGGEGWPRATSEQRRTSLRANSLSPDVWGMALFAGMLGLVALFPLLGVLGRLVTLPAEAQPIRVPPEMPFATVVFLLLMASLVAGVVEEAAFRGYLQGPIERRHGPVAAILGSGLFFGLAHYAHHPEGTLAMLPYYLGVTAVYGGLAYATNSILPGLVLHAGGDVLVLNRLWLTGLPEWQTSAKAAPLIWETGADAAFWGNLAMLILLGAAAVWAFAALAASARPVASRRVAA
jgi:membrane protease YdiL (CAAX protease family)